MEKEKAILDYDTVALDEAQDAVIMIMPPKNTTAAIRALKPMGTLGFTRRLIMV